MSTKTISIRDDVHKRLVEAKRQEESFSDVIDRLLKKENADLSLFYSNTPQLATWNILPVARIVRKLESINPTAL